MLRTKRVEAREALLYQAPRFVPWVYAFIRLISPHYLRLVEGIDRVQVQGIEHLIHAYREFYRGSNRLLIAYRPPSVHGPPVMAYLLSRKLPRSARSSRLRCTRSAVPVDPITDEKQARKHRRILQECRQKSYDRSSGPQPL
jgi:hypothetical protein